MMFRKRIGHAVVLGVIALVAAGCGSGEDEPTSGRVITPSATPEPEPGGDTAAQESAGDSAVADSAVAETTPAESTTPSEPEPSDQPAVAEEPSADKGTTFKGRVVVTGTPPTPSPIKPSGNDPFCVNLDEIPNDEVLIGEGNGLADVFVWLRKVPSGVETPEPPDEPVVLDQKGCRFIPPALIVQAGQTLLIKNDDATLHNTKMGGFKNSFNTAVSPNNRTGEEVKIEYAEIIPLPVECNVHGWMSARVLATDNPWYAITDKDGHFEINNLPSDVELEFRLQHGKAGYVERSLKLTLAENEVKEQTFELDATKLAD